MTSLEVISKEQKDEFMYKKVVLDYFADIIPIKFKKVYILEKQWISANLIAKVKTVISDLINSFDKQYDAFQQNVDNILTHCVTEYFSKINFFKKYSIDQATLVYTHFSDFINKGSKASTFEAFISSLSNEMVNKIEKEQLLKKKIILQVFIDILPANYKLNYDAGKQWISVNLISKVRTYMDQLVNHFDNQYKSFQFNVEKALSKGLSEYFSLVINQADDINEITMLKNMLFSLLHKPNVNIESFINDINDKILSKKIKSEFLKNNEALNKFLQKLPKQTQINFPNERKWIGLNLISKINNLISELDKFYVETDTFKDGSFIYRGYFTKMS